MTAALATCDRLGQALAAVTTLDDAKAIVDEAAVLVLRVRQATDGLEAEVRAGEVRIRAELRLGQLLVQYRADGLIRPGAPRTAVANTDCAGRVTLAALRIDSQLAIRATRYAGMAAQAFEAGIADRRAAIERGDKRVSVFLPEPDGKAERRAQRELELGGRILAFPEKRYGVILDDPEWRYEVWSRETGLDRAADNHYPTSPLDEILARPVTRLAAPDCAWFRWATVPFLAAALRSMEIDGFTYRTHWIWAKDRIGTGYWNRNRHEVLLLAVRGDVPCPAPGSQADSLLPAPVTAHSAKPEPFLAMIEAYFPTLPKIELNRRGPPRPGWDAWGNEAELGDDATTEAA